MIDERRSLIAAIVPAAGKGERYTRAGGVPGRSKLEVPIDGEAMLDRVLRTLAGGGVDRIVVVRAREASLSGIARLADPRVSIAVNPDPSRGMLSSIQEGLRALEADADPVLVLPGDMPFVSAGTVERVIAEFHRHREAVVIPTFESRRGHPVAVPAVLRPAILAEPPESTLSRVLSPCPRVELPVDDPGVTRDVDVPSDLSRG